MMRRTCAPLVRNASFKQAMQMLLTADWIDAHTVQSIVCKPAAAVRMGKRCCKTIVK